MPSRKFNPGDLVQLKSGGPKMVVEQFESYIDVYTCTWFSGAKHNSQTFREEALVPYEENEK